MSKICLRHNLGGQSKDLPHNGMIESRGLFFPMAPCMRGLRPYTVCFLGGLIFWGIGVVAVEGKIKLPSQPNTLAEKSAAHHNSRQSVVKRRDPFKPIKKRLPTEGLPEKSHSELTIAPVVEDPAWRLLGVLHGQDGHQAVIQISPKKRVLVHPGSELVGSGWTIKTISEGEVLLEYLSSTSSVGVSSPPRNFILSFPTFRKSP